MLPQLKVAIIGEYNFTYYSHQATNLALDHTSLFLEVDINYYWIRTSEATLFKPTQWDQYDAIWIAPGPFSNYFYLHGIIKELSKLSVPVLLTGDSFKTLIDVIIVNHNLNPNQEKLISDNLISGNSFEKINVIPHSKVFIDLLKHHQIDEFSSSRFSIYPQLLQQICPAIIDVEAYNQFEEPEIISLQEHPFFVAAAYCPQITSTRELPHPIIYTLIKMGMINKGLI